MQTQYSSSASINNDPRRIIWAIYPFDKYSKVNGNVLCMIFIQRHEDHRVNGLAERYKAKQFMNGVLPPAWTNCTCIVNIKSGVGIL
jgi:hypothetical protein